MNFGAFAGGLSDGIERGQRLGKTMRELYKEGALQKLREQGMAEAEAQRSQSAADLIKETGVTGQPTSGPVSTETPNVEAMPVPPPTSVAAQGLPPLAPRPAAVGANAEGSQGEAEAAAAMQAPPSVSTQTPAPVGPGAAAQEPAAAAPAAVVQTTPQGVAGAGLAPVVKKPSGKFSVNGQSYDTREQAMAAAEKAAPSATDLFMKNAVPKISEFYLKNGDPEKAAAWDKYADSQNGKRAMKDWAAAYTAPDLDTAVNKFGKYYTDHINDGVDYTGHKILTKDDGTQVAVVTLKDKATGKSQEMELTREKMLALGGANNPQKLFEQEVAKQTAAEKLKLEASLKARERSEKVQDDRKNEAYKQDRMDQRERIKASAGMEEAKGKAQVGIDTKIDALIGAGYGEDEVKKMMPAIVGAADHKRTTDPTERRALIASDLLKNAPSFGRKEKAEQNRRIDDMMGIIYGDEAAPKKSAVSIADKPMAFNKDLPVKYRKSDGKPFHLVDGKYVPIDGAVTPQAGGLPRR